MGAKKVVSFFERPCVIHAVLNIRDRSIRASTGIFEKIRDLLLVQYWDSETYEMASLRSLTKFRGELRDTSIENSGKIKRYEYWEFSAISYISYCV